MLTSSGRKHFFVGLNTGFVTDGVPDKRCRDFYSRRSGHGLYCAIIGNVVIPGGQAPNSKSAAISSAGEWRLLSQAIASEGPVPGIQLATTWAGYQGRRKFVSPSTTSEIANCKAIADSVLVDDLERLFCALRAGTELAIDAGFRHMQLHAAHGYLFSLLLDGRFYLHADRAIGKLNEWANWLGGIGIETSIRVSLRTGDRTFDNAGAGEFLDKMALLPVNYLDVSSGFYEIDKRLIYPSLPGLLLQRRVETLALASRNAHTQFVYSGRSVLNPQDELPGNVHIGLCRDLIANPDFLRDYTDGCANTMKCHWYSRNRDHIDCGRWATGYEGPNRVARK